MRRLVRDTPYTMICCLTNPKWIESWIREHMVYTDDIPVEVIRTPANMLEAISQRGFFNGDCDDAAVLAGAMAYTANIPCRFVAISEGILSSDYSHVFVEMLFNNQWVVVDPTIVPGTVMTSLNTMRVTI